MAVSTPTMLQVAGRPRNSGLYLPSAMSLVVAWIIGIVVVQSMHFLPSNTLLNVVLLVMGGCFIAGYALVRVGFDQADADVRRRLFSFSSLTLHGVCQWGVWCFVWTAIALLGGYWAAEQGASRLEQRPSCFVDDTEHVVMFTVVGYPTQSGEGGQTLVQALVELRLDPPSGLPRYVQLQWPRACLHGCRELVEPGQQWRARLRLRYIDAPMNMHGSDAQSVALQQGVFVKGTVRGAAQRLGMDPSPSWRTRLSRWRWSVAQKMRMALQGQSWSGVLIALALGDQSGISQQQRSWFTRTGISHLVAISGTHIGLLASLLGGLMCVVFRRVRVRLLSESNAAPLSLLQWQPERIIFMVTAVVSAFLYCLLAGWGVPAQRAFFSLLCAAFFISGRSQFEPQTGWALALLVVSALDPMAILGKGLWLSFGAVAALIWYAKQFAASSAAKARVNSQDPASGRLRTRCLSCWHGLLALCRLQVTITLATLPLVAWLFHEVSLVSVPANLWAATWVSLVVTPLAMLLAVWVCLPLPDGWVAIPVMLAQGSASLALWPIEWLATRIWAVWEVPASPWWVGVSSVFGVVLALTLPRCMPRHLAWLLLLPQLFWRPLSPEYGGWRLLAFDVGQGSAILLQTATHQLLFDTGWGFGQQDAVARYVLPELKALGIRHLDDVVISHPDQDHIGGLATLEKRREIGVLRGSGLMPRHYVACRRGQRWSYDGVAFIMLAPLDNCASRALKGVERNRCSCVLKIQGTWHSALLPGDIDSHVERQILEITLGTDHTNKRRALRGSTKSANKADMDPSFSLGSVDVVLMAHHGSRYSSDPQWVKALSARHAISQSGRHNRYGHPHPEIEQRWQKSGAEVWATVRDGAILVESNQTGLWVQSERKQRRRYWHRTDKPHEKHHQEEP